VAPKDPKQGGRSPQNACRAEWRRLGRVSPHSPHPAPVQIGQSQEPGRQEHRGPMLTIKQGTTCQQSVLQSQSLHLKNVMVGWVWHGQWDPRREHGHPKVCVCGANVSTAAVTAAPGTALCERCCMEVVRGSMR